MAEFTDVQGIGLFVLVLKVSLEGIVAGECTMTIGTFLRFIDATTRWWWHSQLRARWWCCWWWCRRTNRYNSTLGACWANNIKKNSIFFYTFIAQQFFFFFALSFLFKSLFFVNISPTKRFLIFEMRKKELKENSCTTFDKKENKI